MIEEKPTHHLPCENTFQKGYLIEKRHIRTMYFIFIIRVKSHVLRVFNHFLIKHDFSQNSPYMV
jgi:aspartyl/asparaginyl-tRNA synthetase